jgi:PIN like domain
MRDLFPGFYHRTEEELSMLWREAILVFDTNMLLNIYRYHEETRKRFFEILEQFEHRIWIPHQALYEYQNNRLEVISQQSKVYGEVSKVLKEAQSLLLSLRHMEGKHSFIKIDDIIEAPIKSLREANDKLSTNQKTSKEEIEKLKVSDGYRERVAQLFQDKIGTPYSRESLFGIYKLADKRFELQIPPGWKDKGKKTYDKYGDVVLWFQLVDYAFLQKKPILFVTDDVKSDWFLPMQESNGLHRPRPELVQEMFVEAGVLLHIYQGYEFIDIATQSLKLKPEPRISEDAKEVTERNALEEEIGFIQAINSRRNLREIEEEITSKVTEAVINWLRKRTSYKNIIPRPESKSRGFILVEPNGNNMGAKIKIEFDFRWIVREANYLLNHFAEHMLFVVYMDESNAIQAANLIERSKLISSTPQKEDLYFPDSTVLYLPSGTSIIIGYFQADEFIFVGSYPHQSLFEMLGMNTQKESN